MTRLEKLVARLTPIQVKEVEDFAEFLGVRAEGTNGAASATATTLPTPMNFIDVDKLMGMCAGMGGDKPDEELIREAWNGVIDKLEK